ncbi:UNVERIFIED_CONTAM: hypothetical protein HDU68_000697 [Siphonaria sp. JEL0065]|nr:hypothetical protein HDU68_000697 [Siphonaria sp. JEL0065]
MLNSIIDLADLRFTIILNHWLTACLRKLEVRASKINPGSAGGGRPHSSDAIKGGFVDLTGSDDGNDQPVRAAPIRIRTTSSSSQLEPIDLIQDLDPEEQVHAEAEEEYIGLCHEKIVGIKYYTGVVLAGENVSLVREPHNPYDSNAIQVKNIAGVQVGHIPRGTAMIVAKMIDERALRIEGVVQTKPRAGAASVAIILAFYCLKAERKNDIARRLQGALGLSNALPPVVAAPVTTPKRAQAVNPMQEWEKLLQRGSVMTPQASSVLIEKLVLSEKDLEKLDSAIFSSQQSAEHPQLPDSDEPVQFWKYEKKTKHYVNICTNSAVFAPPTLARGGILADDMGLGKTLQIISLICSNPSGEGIAAKPVPTSPNYSKTTLIICPLSVISNWVDQFKQHTSSDSISVYVFHGKDRNTSPSFLAECDVVVTTYNMLAQADVGYKTGLHKIKWRRVVLDEGHIIRNRNSKQTKAIVALDAERHLVVSGTPIQNSVEDLYSLMWFMKFAPFSDHDWFNRLLTRPLRQNTDIGKNTLKLFMSQCCLRRNKGMTFNGLPILSLPPCNTYLHSIDFKYEDEKKAYKALNAEFEKRFDEFADEGASYAHILEILIRLRQVCCHPSLIGDRKLLIEKTAKDAFTAAKLNPNNPKIQRLLSILREHVEDDCAICLDSMTKPVVTQCGHFYCDQCIRDVIRIQQGSPCPMCRQKLTDQDLLELFATAPPMTEEFGSTQLDEELIAKLNQGEDDRDGSALKQPRSAKIDVLLELLTAATAKDPTSKSIVFSQWSKMLNIVEPFLQDRGITYVRFDGSMTRKARLQAIERFKEKDANVNVFLATLKSAGVGLNLVEANLVFLLDPWWNASVENQGG